MHVVPERIGIESRVPLGWITGMFAAWLLRLRALFILVPPLLLGSIVVVRAGEDAPRIDFAHSVVPILRKHCVECHGGHRSEGGFSLNTRESLLDSGVVLPGDVEGSHLIELITTTDAEQRMPKKRSALSAKEVESLRQWIRAGLSWDAGFTFAVQTYEPPLRPRQPQLPPAVDGRENPIDRIVDSYLATHARLPLPPLEDEAFLRRVSLDLTGLLPTPERLRAFAADQNPAKRQHLIDESLNDCQAYAEHWFSFWSDLLRNDFEGTGYIDDGRRHLSIWLYRSLLENKPYDQFVRELVSPSAESEGFIRGIKWRGNVNASQKPELQFAQNVSQVFLGINLKCASCHDSFVDRWTLSQTYALAAVCAEGPMEMYRCDQPTGESVQAAWMFPELGQIDPASPRDERLRRLSELMTSADNGRLPRTIVNRLWHRFMGRGIVHPVDAMQTEPWSADLLDYLASHLIENRYDLKSTLRLIASSRAYQTAAASADMTETDFVYSGPIAKRMSAEQFVDAVWQITSTGPPQPHPETAVFIKPSVANGRTWYRASLVGNDALMRSLGRPSREQVVSDRPSLLGTLQALDLANSALLAKTLDRGATNVLSRFADGDATAIVGWLYEAALSRTPTPEELAIGQALLGSPPSAEGMADLLWVVMMLPEFQIID